MAGAIALVMSREPELNAFEAAARLEGWASNDRATWEPADDTMGAGRARLQAIIDHARESERLLFQNISDSDLETTRRVLSQIVTQQG